MQSQSYFFAYYFAFLGPLALERNTRTYQK